jgi:hypothetical protein
VANYFDTFQVMQYANSYCRNIVTRSAIARNVKDSVGVFYPYQIKEGQRPDVLAHLYYRKSSLEWLVFFANDIIDPYYEWYLSEEQLRAAVTDKYGSLANAQTKTKHYEVNWVGDDSTITISAYDALAANTTANVKQYWQPMLNEYSAVIAYKRKPLDLYVNTNKVITLAVQNTAGFTSDEVVYQQTGSTITSRGVLEIANTSHLTVKHVSGTFTTPKIIIGSESSSQTIVTAVTTLHQNIPDTEAIYWTPVSYYDYEIQRNERRKVLRIIDSAYAELAESNLKQLMK